MPTEKEEKQTVDNKDTDNDKVKVEAKSAETENTDSEHMIPKSRYDDANKKYQDEKKRADALEKANKESADAQLKEKEDFKTLYEQAQGTITELKPKAEIVDQAEETLKEVLTSQVEQIPEDRRQLIPTELSTKKQLDWISKNRALLLKPSATDIGAGKKGGSEDTKTKITPAIQKGIDAFNLSQEQVENIQKRKPLEGHTR